MATQPWGLGILALTVALGLYLGALGVRDLFQSTGIVPIDYIIRNLLGRLNPPQVIETPRQGVREEPQNLYGPRRVTVQPDTAAVMIRGSRQTRIVGPGTFISDPFEYAERSLNMRPIHRNYQFGRILTRDRLATEVSLAITYSIRVGLEARLGQRPLNADEINNLVRLANWTPDWETALREVVGKYVRISIGFGSIGNALDVSRTALIESEIRRGAESEVATWGIAILELDLIGVQPDADIVSASSDNWLVALRNDTLIRRESARGTAWAQAINAIATAYQEVQANGLPDRVVYRELLRRLFEQASLDPEVRGLLQAELGRALDRTNDGVD